MSDVPKPVVLVVLDGFGVSLSSRGNAVIEANTPNLDAIEQRFPFTTLQASGAAVGLPWGEAGNSEVGHLTMGAGRVIYHHLPRIIAAIHDGSFYENPAFRKIVGHVRERGSSLHLLGLVSSGTVHSYIDHLLALLELAKREDVPAVYLHVITDGKDAPRDEAASFVGQLQERIARHYPGATIASLVGRYYAMDRDEQWERVRAAYDLLTNGKGEGFEDAGSYLRRSYERGVFDEFIKPALLTKNGEAIGHIREGDGLIFFNFREDSVREITSAFGKEHFDAFPRRRVSDLAIATMTEYEKNLPGVEAAFPPLEIVSPLAEVLAEHGKTQLHIAESEKYAHVTYFFNGGNERLFRGEDRLLIPSLSVPHFDEHPEMKASEIVSRVIERLNQYGFILVNFANADMVGHTGNFEAAVKAVEVLDEAIGRIEEAVRERKGSLLITGDHGNVEEKIHRLSGEPVSEHTANPVPFYLVAEEFARTRERTPEEISATKKEVGGILTDVAPTVLELMALPQPPEMTGRSLLPLLLNQA